MQAAIMEGHETFLVLTIRQLYYHRANRIEADWLDLRLIFYLHFQPSPLYPALLSIFGLSLQCWFSTG